METTEWFRKCACGQAFYKPNSFSNHINSCKRYKKDLGATLENARARYANKARTKKGKEAIETWLGGSSLDVDHEMLQPQQAPDFDMASFIEHSVPLMSAESLSQQPLLIPEELEEPQGRGFRLRAPTQRYKDFSLTCAIPLAIPMSGEVIDSPPSSPPPSDTPISTAEAQRYLVLEKARWKETQKNGFGLYKVYWTTEAQPHDPDLFLSDIDLKDDEQASESVHLPQSLNRYYPFPNWSSYMLGDWYWDDRTGKSRDSFQQLVGIITDPAFKPNDIRDTNWKRVNDILALSEFEGAVGQEDGQWVDDGTSWASVTVVVDVPFNTTSTKPGSQPYQFNNFRYRPLIPIIIAKLKDLETSDHFHIIPSELRWQAANGESFRVYADMYHSDAFLDAYKEIQTLPPEPVQDDLPRCVIALMFASDETMLTSFGNAKLWPVYLQFGNETKYRRGKVSLKLFEEVAYFQSIPDVFHDWYLQESGKKVVGDPLLSHVRRELFHAQWKVLLDSDFVHAYEHGLVVDCCDGVRRRVYPRIMTYAADYPERVTVVGVRHLGDYPCPRCLVSLDEIQLMGTQSDRILRSSRERVDDGGRKNKVVAARDAIYKKNYSVNAAVVESHLKPASLNAFSDHLSDLGLDMHRMLAVDILHEVEIGSWKSLFIHLLRLLDAIDPALIGILNSCYRQLPTFGRDTIRRFSRNIADRKQFGAREYEDALQCAIAAFEGLFPDDHDDRVQNLLYSMASWHAFAKLRMHTDRSLHLLDSWTSILGEDARIFVSLTCGSFQTRELKKEYEARKRADARKRSTKSPKGRNRSKTATVASAQGTRESLENVDSSDANAAETEGRKYRTWNLSTPKFHGIGDVVACIKRFGTTDSYSTQMSERFHVSPKSRYRRTNKKDVARQLSRMQMRQSRIKKLRNQLYPSSDEKGTAERSSTESAGPPLYFIGKSQNQPVNLSHFIRLNANDLATKGFLQKLKQHLFPRVIEALTEEAKAQPERHSKSLARLAEFSSSGDIIGSESDINSIYFHSETIYRHNVLQIQYTTYDCRQDCDTMNPSTSRRDFMCVAAKDVAEGDGSQGPDAEGTQYVYGRLLGVFHANVMYMGPGTLDYRRRRFDFLWVRWFEAAPAAASYPIPPGPTKRMDRVRLVPLGDKRSWGFIDPSHILRAAHLLPRFTLHTLDKDEGTGRIFSKCARERQDWEEYYVNRFVDRDMFMRFHPRVAVGHSSGQNTTVQEQSRSDTPMEVDVPTVEEHKGVAIPPVQNEGSTDSEDSDYERREDELDQSPSNSETEDESERESLEQDPDSEDDGSDIYS